MVSDRQPRTEADAEENCVTFLDLPREILSMILRKISDHRSLLEVAAAHDTLQAIVDRENSLWQSLCQFHFQPYQVIFLYVLENLRFRKKKSTFLNRKVKSRKY